MRVLWLCNLMLPVIAQQFHAESSSKEGWLSGLLDTMLAKQKENGISLSIAFPVPPALLKGRGGVLEREIVLGETKITCYGFRENRKRPDRYDAKLERYMRKIVKSAQPDVVHCFGTEYPHTLAMCLAFPDPDRILITIQGLCAVCANVYTADLPEEVIRQRTLRDFLKRDGILQQKEKFIMRGIAERRAIAIAGNVGGRTDWDRYYAREWHREAVRYELKETLRPDFYEGRWSRKECQEHSIFVSQGDYPIKGLHYLLLALPRILEKVPDTHVYVAGNSIVRQGTLKDRLKQSSYGRYLRSLMEQYHLEDKVTFLGMLDSGQMKERYLRSHLFVCCSAIENSPNSLGEAMMLGMPCVAADVGGIPSIFTGGEDGILYEGCKSRENDFDQNVYEGKDSLLRIAENLSRAILELWADEEKESFYCENARRHAIRDHDREANYAETLEAYAKIAKVEGQS